MNSMWCTFWMAWIIGGQMATPQRAGEYERPLVREVWPHECETWNRKDEVKLYCKAV